MSIMQPRALGWLIPAVLLLTTQEADTQTKANDQPASQFNGKVLRRDEFAKQKGVKLEPGNAFEMALLTDDGKILPLEKTDHCAMFFLDPEVLNRPVRLTGQWQGTTKSIKVSKVHSYLDGKLHEVFYWCEKCQLSAPGPGVCPCCGAILERREIPVK